MYLKAWNTQESIADSVGVDKATISRIINSLQKAITVEMQQNFKPLLYNIWNTPKQDNDRKHFGAFPFADNKYNG